MARSGMRAILVPLLSCIWDLEQSCGEVSGSHFEFNARIRRSSTRHWISAAFSRPSSNGTTIAGWRNSRLVAAFSAEKLSLGRDELWRRSSLPPTLLVSRINGLSHGID